MDDNQEGIRLLLEIANGSQDAFEQFYELYNRFVYYLAFQIVSDPVEAEDICHDVFLEVFQKNKEYQPVKGSVKAWIAVKTKSRAIDRLRKKQPILVNKLEGLLLKKDVSTDVKVLSHLEREAILSALEKLPREQSKAIYEAYFKGRTHKEIAYSMNKPLGSVKSFIRYGLMNLRKQKSIIGWMGSSGGGKK